MDLASMGLGRPGSLFHCPFSLVSVKRFPFCLGSLGFLRSHAWCMDPWRPAPKYMHEVQSNLASLNTPNVSVGTFPQEMTKVGAVFVHGYLMAALNRNHTESDPFGVTPGCPGHPSTSTAMPCSGTLQLCRSADDHHVLGRESRGFVLHAGLFAFSF